MNPLNIDKMGAKNKVANISSKPQASIDKTEIKEELQAAKEIKEYEIKMEQADNAFALINEIQVKLKKALEDTAQ